MAGIFHGHLGRFERTLTVIGGGRVDDTTDTAGGGAVLLVWLSTFLLTTASTRSVANEPPVAPAFQCGGVASLVHGEVIGISLEMLDDGFPLTWYQLQVTEEIGATVYGVTHLGLPGGILSDGTVVALPHYPKFALGDEIIASVISANVYGAGRVRLVDGQASTYVLRDGATDGLFRPWWDADRPGDIGDTADGSWDMDDGQRGPLTELPLVELGVLSTDLKNDVRLRCLGQEGPDLGINHADVDEALNAQSGGVMSSSAAPASVTTTEENDVLDSGMDEELTQ